MRGKLLLLLILSGFYLSTSPGAAQERSPRITNEWEFRDEDGNQRIDPKEKVLLILNLKNIGEARANHLMLSLSETNGIQGLEFQAEMSLGRHSINAVKEVEIPVIAGSGLQSGEAHFLIEVYDRSGYRAEPLSLLVQCRGKDNQSTVREAVISPVEPPRAASESFAQEKMRGVGDPLKGLNVSSPRDEMHFGDYYALIIGIDHYRGF